MNFYLSKLGFLLVSPSNLIGISLFIGVFCLLIHKIKTAKLFLCFSAFFVVLFGYSSFSNYAVLLLEERFPKHALQMGESHPAPHGIIILGGSVNPYLSAKRGIVSVNETVERITESVELSRRFPTAKLIFTGGTPHILDNDFQSEAALTKAFFHQIGFNDSKVLYEDKSINTYENAFLTAKLLNPKPEQKYLLVTSAFHMPRSMAFFRAAGFNVEAYPVDYLTAGWVAAKRPHFTMTGGLNMADVAMKEWLGLFAYWITGKIPEFYPAP